MCWTTTLCFAWRTKMAHLPPAHIVTVKRPASLHHAKLPTQSCSAVRYTSEMLRFVHSALSSPPKSAIPVSTMFLALGSNSTEAQKKTLCQLLLLAIGFSHCLQRERFLQRALIAWCCPVAAFLVHMSTIKIALSADVIAVHDKKQLQCDLSIQVRSRSWLT